MQALTAKPGVGYLGTSVSIEASLPAVSKSQLVNFAVLPLVMAIFFALRIVAQTHPEIDAWIPRWDRLMLFAVVILLERIYHYRYAVSQRYVLMRDIISNIVTLYVNGFVTALFVLPVLLYLPEHFLGRKLIFASPDRLGPVWLQIAIITVFVSFFRYWMHRLQHESRFLWELHAYHHQVTDLKAINTYVSHPIDYALRNILVYLVVGIVGFYPIAILIAVPLTFIRWSTAALRCGFEGRDAELRIRDARGASMASLRQGPGRLRLFLQLRSRLSYLGHAVRNLLFAPEGRADLAARAHRPSGRIARRRQLPAHALGATGTLAAILAKELYRTSRDRKAPTCVERNATLIQATHGHA